MRSFDPPVPPRERAAVIVARTAVLTALVLAAAPFGYFGEMLLALALGAGAAAVQRARGRAVPRRWRGLPVHGFPEPVVPADLHLTSPPEVTAAGVACCGCDAVVPFASMSINEDGYFCPACARAA